MTRTAHVARRSKVRPGRAVGKPPNRQAILAAALTEFTGQGYDGATMRGIAARAGVDLALLYHYFGSKDRLFVAALQLPDNPAQAVAEMVAGGIDGLGERLLRHIIGTWEQGTPGNAGPFVGVMRSAASHEEAGRIVREFFTRELLERLVVSIGMPQPRLRAALMGSQLLGLAWARRVLRLEPIASADIDTLVACYAPTLQRYLTAPLPGDDDADSGNGLGLAPESPSDRQRVAKPSRR
ncbi:MAG: TetR family transcriptional regulator [Candidatus Dormibacteraeota bacterium]|nr:TetR family transcriptional regulator [Candidatus Dormibacteraeota bacterium]